MACSEHEDSSSLRLHIGASMIPHPEKMHKGGEDAYFMTEDGKFLGEHTPVCHADPQQLCCHRTMDWSSPMFLSHSLQALRMCASAASAKGAYLRVGVADGVGGWSQINVDSGVYSRLLMQTAKAAASVLAPSPIAPQIVLEEAHKKTNVRVR